MSRKLIIYILSIFLIIYLGYLGYLVLKSKTFESLVGGVDYSCADNTKCSSGLCFNAGFAGKGGFCAPPGFSWDKFRAAPQYANDDSLINGVGVADSGWTGAQTMAQKAAAQQAAADLAAAAAEAAKYNKPDLTVVTDAKYCVSKFAASLKSDNYSKLYCYSTNNKAPKDAYVNYNNANYCASGKTSWDRWCA